MMIGDTSVPERARRASLSPGRAVAFEIAGVSAENDDGSPAIEAISLKLHAGEIVGIAGVSGNGQSALVEVLTGQRPLRTGRLLADGRRFPADPRGDGALQRSSACPKIR